MSDKIYQAMANIMGRVTAITKAQQNKDQRFNFRGIDDVYNTLHPLLAEYQVFTLMRVIDCQRSEYKTAHGKTMQHVLSTVEYDFMASDGSKVTVRSIGEGADMGDKAAAKSLSNAHKYAFFQTFSIPTGELDPDAESPDMSGGAVKGNNDPALRDKFMIELQEIEDNGKLAELEKWYKANRGKILGMPEKDKTDILARIEEIKGGFNND